jgi:hypothetical protein
MKHRPGFDLGKTPREEIFLEGKPKWRGTKIIDEDRPWVHVTVDFVRYGLSSNAFKVFMVLKTYANERRDIDKDGLEVWPSQETIAADAGVSIRTCRRALAKLSQLGLLVAHRVGVGMRGHAHNVYVLKKRPLLDSTGQR